MLEPNRSGLWELNVSVPNQHHVQWHCIDGYQGNQQIPWIRALPSPEMIAKHLSSSQCKKLSRRLQGHKFFQRNTFTIMHNYMKVWLHILRNTGHSFTIMKPLYMYTRLEQLCKLMVDSGNQFITVLYIHIYFFVLPAENHLVSENKEVLGKT